MPTVRDASDRRFFLQSSSAAAGAGLLTAGVHSSVAAAEEPRMYNVAVIGPGGMGSGHLSLLVRNPQVRVAYVCDPDANRLAVAKKTCDDRGHAAQAVKDMREIFADKTVDAVWIATPDHWHAPAAILAAEAKKHVYVEKPCSHNLREGRLMIEAARRNKVVMQVGTQSRSTPTVISAIEKLQSGAIGEVLVAKAWNSQRRGQIGKSQPSTAPPHLDFDLWLGPTPETPYRSNYLHSIWRWWHAFGVGDIGNDGVHDLDVAAWGLGVTTHPTTVAGLGSKSVFDDDQQWPDTQYAVFEYAGATKAGRPKQLIYEQRIWSPYVQEGYENGAAFYGTEGMLICGHSFGWKLYGPRNKLLQEAAGSPDLAAHHRNFLECLPQGATPNADIAINHLSTSLCHLANIAHRTRTTLNFDPQNEKFVGAASADAFLTREYRAGHWAVPAGV